MVEQQNRRLLEDGNGVLFALKPGGLPLLVDQPLTNDFVDRLKEVLTDRINVENIQQRLRYVLDVPNNNPWKCLNKDSLDVKEGRFNRLIERWNRGFYKAYFGNYDISPKEIDGIHAFSLYGQKEGFNTVVTLYSGIPYAARGVFIKEIQAVKGDLDPKLSIILKPNNRRSSVFLKTAVAAMLGFFECVLPVEDDFYVAQILAGFCNLEVFMPIDEKTARSQPHLHSLSLPAGLSRTNGNIVFNSGALEVTDKLSGLVKQ